MYILNIFSNVSRESRIFHYSFLRTKISSIVIFYFTITCQIKNPTTNALKKLWQLGVVTGETIIFLHVKHENHTYKYLSLC